MPTSILQVVGTECVAERNTVLTFTETVRHTIIVTASPKFAAVTIPHTTAATLPLGPQHTQNPAHQKHRPFEALTLPEAPIHPDYPHDFPHPPLPGWRPHIHTPSILQPLCGTHNPSIFKSHLLDTITDNAHTPFDCYEKCNVCIFSFASSLHFSNSKTNRT